MEAVQKNPDLTGVESVTNALHTLGALALQDP
jgi:hypothetical protein